MDKYLKSKIKLWILQAFNWIPDKQMIQLQYRIKTKRKLNLKPPTRYNEKLQWYKLYYRKLLMARCADKWEVRKYVTEKGYGDILNESYGVFDDAAAIPFDKFPDQFVIKATNGASGIGIKLCLNKDSLAIQDLRREINGWLKPQKNGGGREWVYYRTKPRILIEKYLHPGIGEESLMTYKIFCFQGKPCYLYVINEKFTERNMGFSILDTDYRPTPYFLGGGGQKKVCRCPAGKTGKF